MEVKRIRTLPVMENEDYTFFENIQIKQIQTDIWKKLLISTENRRQDIVDKKMDGKEYI